MLSPFESQHIFRRLLDSMANPGNINELHRDVLCKGSFPEEHLTVMTIAGTLFDSEVTFAPLDSKMKELAPLISLSTESQLAEPEEADFLLADGLYSATEISYAKRGTLFFPDKSATLILEVSDLFPDEMNEGANIIVEGPGVPGNRLLVVCGLLPENLIFLQEANKEFPLGVDAIFVSRSNKVACLPRSVGFELLEASYRGCFV